jgi:hypothetical protein
MCQSGAREALAHQPYSGENFQEPLIILRQYPGVVTNSASIPLVRQGIWGGAYFFGVGQKRATSTAD